MNPSDGENMNTKVAELMSKIVVTAEPHHSIEHVRKLLDGNGFSSVPVVDSDGQPVGIVSATDLAHDLKAGAAISSIMTKKVYVVPKYEDTSIAARIMRNHKIHHVVVTHEKEVVGILSAFDLLKLVEDHRYVAKNPPQTSRRKGTKRH
jgi:CBS domain-containing protein